jgi:hypothetical protein
MGLSFIIAAGPRPRSHFRVWVSRNSWPYFTVSDLRLPPTWRARSPYLYPPRRGWPSHNPRHCFLFVASYDSQGYGGGIRTSLHRSLTKLRVRVRVIVTLRLAVYCHSVRLGDKILRLTTRIFNFPTNTCGYSPYVTSSLTRGWVCRLQLLLGLDSSVILRPESRGLMTTFYCLKFKTPQPGVEGSGVSQCDWQSVCQSILVSSSI